MTRRSSWSAAGKFAVLLGLFLASWLALIVLVLFLLAGVVAALGWVT